MSRRNRPVGWWYYWSIIMVLVGCGGPPKEVGLSDLENPAPALRIRAIKWAGENRLAEAIPLLIDRLQEQDASVRFYAIMSLKRITGADHGYDYKSDAAARAEAVARWRQWLGQRDKKEQR